MTYKFEIVNNSLVVTNTDTNRIVLDEPKQFMYYNFKYLTLDTDPRIVIQNTQSTKKNIIDKDIRLSQAVDSTLTPFNETTFTDFVRNNLGF